MSILKATVTEVKIGPIVLSGLMDENGEFSVAIPQIAEIGLVPPNRSSRQLQALTGEAFQTHKLKTEFNPKPVNAISLDTLQTIIRALDKKGNPVATSFVDALFGLSLYQLFCDAFGRKFDEEDRQRSLTTRLATKIDFRGLTDELKRHGFSEGWEFGRFVGAMQTKLGIKSGERDYLDVETLVKLQSVQVKLITLMECGITPWEALKRI